MYKQERSIDVKVKRLSPDVKLPTQAYKGDAGWDVYSVVEVYIPAGEMREVKTGISLEVPVGWQTQIHTRSSYGKKCLKCHLGIIDSGYRNEISVWLFNHGKEGHYIRKGDKVCQLLFLPVPEVKLTEVQNLNSSERGLRGHGSTGN